MNFKKKINPQTLTILTAKSSPNDKCKDKMIGIVGLLLNPLGEAR